MYTEPEKQNDKIDFENTNLSTDNELEQTTPTRKRSRLQKLVIWFGFCVFLFIGLNFTYQFLASAPKSFPVDQPVEIVRGTSVIKIAEQLKDAGVVRSELLLYAVLVAYYEPTDIKASTYIFSSPLSVYEVARALTEGNYSYDLVRFTHKEGMSVRAMAPDIAAAFPHITEAEFISYATPFEGELFPETYFVPKDISIEDLVALMRELYNDTISSLYNIPAEHSLEKQEVLILASILEREANSIDSMRQVANILLRRLSIDMPLQVDATMEYVLDKPLSELLPEDLQEDSPYNTYTRFGLPPTPIGNPGAEALNAVIHATTATPYLFYITGNDGNFYYAEDFDQHRINIDRYLR
ncbi:MAG: endolytic transglycosylase MltG [Candidatus Paceibacteria bacterium]